MNKFFILIIFMIGLGACKHVGDESVTIIKNGSEPGYIIHLKKIKDSTHLNLSDLAKDFEFIALETKPECIFSKGDVYISDEYILVMKPNHGILQFNRHGKFVRTLVKVGEGPAEYSRAYWTVNEKNQTLYLSDYGKDNYFLQYDLHSGVYIGDLKKAITGKTKDILYEDNSLIVVPTGRRNDNENFYYYYRQNLQGDLIHDDPAPDGFFMKSGGNSLYSTSLDKRYHVPDDDTVYTLQGDKREVFIVFDYGEKNPPNSTFVGHKSLSANLELPSHLWFYNFQVTNIEKEGNVVYTSGAVENYVLDKKKSKAYYSGQMYFNPTNRYIESDQFQFNLSTRNGLVYYVYQSIDLLEHAEKALADSEFKEPYRSRLEEVVSMISENDNPVLLVGQIL